MRRGLFFFVLTMRRQKLFSSFFSAKTKSLFAFFSAFIVMNVLSSSWQRSKQLRRCFGWFWKLPAHCGLKVNKVFFSGNLSKDAHDKQVCQLLMYNFDSFSPKMRITIPAGVDFERLYFYHCMPKNSPVFFLVVVENDIDLIRNACLAIACYGKA